MHSTTTKILVLAAMLFCLDHSLQAQDIPNWQNKDLQKDSLFGISSEKAYAELLQGKTPHPVIVAVIDGGVDTAHEDLKSVLRRDGWSFIGSAKGNVHFDNLELTRQVRQQGKLFEGRDTTRFRGKTLLAFHTYETEKHSLELQKTKMDRLVQGIRLFKAILDSVVLAIGKDSPTLSDFRVYKPTGKLQEYVVQTTIAALADKDDYAAFRRGQVDGPLGYFSTQADYQLNTAYDPRPLYVGDDYFNSKQRDYGSPDVQGPDATHGTHVAGIIAAMRGNGIGMDGVADDVQILPIRAVPDGDERDKDVANAIRYAADHGAKVINMSFGKGCSQDKKAVDRAVRYAMRKDVLLVQAAGNDNADIDTVPVFPTKKFLNGKEAGAYITVGASGMKDDSTLKAGFSNYGKTAVDVFAPGVRIYSTVPGSKYAYFDGSSMAAPVVAGLAALIREYYPRLTAKQVKKIILASAVKVMHPVNLQTGSIVRHVPFTELCATGGIVNAYNALLLAKTYSY